MTAKLVRAPLTLEAQRPSGPHTLAEEAVLFLGVGQIDTAFARAKVAEVFNDLEIHPLTDESVAAYMQEMAAEKNKEVDAAKKAWGGKPKSGK